MVHDPSLAEDLAQETFVKAFRHLGSFDRGRKLSSWLFKIAHNTSLDHLRVPLEAHNASGEESWEVLPASPVDEPDRRAESHEMIQGLERALRRLSPKYRGILLLRFREGLAYREIAEVTDQPVGTVKIQLHRARNALEHEMAKLGLGPGDEE